jgi:hypothetical protein
MLQAPDRPPVIALVDAGGEICVPVTSVDALTHAVTDLAGAAAKG